MTTATTNQQVLDKVQNQALKIITGAMKSTLIKIMEEITGTPLSQRREAKALIKTGKFNYQPDHPMKQKLGNPTKNSLHRSSFVHEANVFQGQTATSLDPTTPFEKTDFQEPWNDNWGKITNPTCSQVKRTSTQRNSLHKT